MSIDPEDIRRLGESIINLDRVVDKLGSSPVNNATVTLQAGGLGVWICATFCSIMFVLVLAGSILGGFYAMKETGRIDRMQDYLNAIYAQAPQLKPKG